MKGEDKESDQQRKVNLQTSQGQAERDAERGQGDLNTEHLQRDIEQRCYDTCERDSKGQ